ncbi:MAG: thioredoxin family protein [Verrucomicrobiales bacterium]
MKHLILKSLAIFAASCSLGLAAEGWGEDFEAAKAVAAKDKKPILVDFTGSDWCGWCIKLDKEVFSQKEFKEYAKDNVVLLKLDFPHEKHQTSKIKSQNEALSKKFGVQGYPTVLLLDADGNKIGETGYQEGGAAKYVEHLKELLAKAKK